MKLLHILIEFSCFSFNLFSLRLIDLGSTTQGIGLVKCKTRSVIDINFHTKDLYIMEQGPS